MTVGGNLLDYADDTNSSTVALTTSKILFNSIVFTQNAKFLGLDIKNFYLQSKLPNSQWMKFLINLIPTEIIKQYNLQDIQHNGWVYLEIVKGMYGLKESGKLVFDQLVKHLVPYGYAPYKYTTGLWKHKNNGITFVLRVDDFGIKYTNKATAQYLINALKVKYECTEDWAGNLYYGIK